MTTGDRMKAIRKELDIPVEDIATALGVSVATVYRYENGDIEKVPGSILEPLAKVLKTTPAYLMGWDEKNPPVQVDERIWKSICDDSTKLCIATWIAGLNQEQKVQVAKVLAAMLGKEIPPSVLE